LATPSEWDGATTINVSLDFRFDDPHDVDNARPIYNSSAFGIDVSGGALNLMIKTETGQKNIWVGGTGFDDLAWHNLDLSIDTVTDQLTLLVDGVAVVDRSDLALYLPESLAVTTLGGMAWGRHLPGEIDNVTISATTPTLLQDAVGNADPVVSKNVGSFLEWGAYTEAPFIDRMKGAHAWEGEFANHFSSTGSVTVFNNTAIFSGGGTVTDLSFSTDMLLNINRVVVMARYGQNIIDNNTYFSIMANPDNYFKIQVGVYGNSELLGRLDTGDAFSLMARFDSDIGMDLGDLRASGNAQVATTDRHAGFSDMVLDENGWPIQFPTDPSGSEGFADTIVMWYPAEAANAPDSIYFGNFYLVADGVGTLNLTQSGSGASLVNLTNVQIDGPTIVPFFYTPNGSAVKLKLISSDPNDTGEYLRDIKVIHEDHWDLYQAGEIFTPEFVELHQDSRVVRWMNAQETVFNPEYAEGNFGDGPDLNYYSYNLGGSDSDPNGIPIDAIIEFSNKTGTDPWISVPINASDAYVTGLAQFIEENLDPKLRVHVELGNENWNAIFDTHQHAKAEGLSRWGELELQMDGSGMFVRDGGGDLIVEQSGYFFSDSDLANNGYANLNQLATELGLGHSLYSTDAAWSEWASMRGTEVGKIFEDVFEAADLATAAGRVNNVLATFSIDSTVSADLLTGAVWQEAEPSNWIDPASVYESLAIGAYFGGTTGSCESDLIDHWLSTLGSQQTADLIFRHLKAGLDPSINLVEFEGDVTLPNGQVDPSKVVTGVHYDANLAIDVYDAIYDNNTNVATKIQNSAGLTQNIEGNYPPPCGAGEIVIPDWDESC
jgi:hypothetical protein